jgi:uncharacterized protein
MTANDENDPLTGESFINRQADLKLLDELNARRGAQFVVVYGRRRIGKTALLNHWLHGRKGPNSPSGLYWVSHRATSEILLASFSEALVAALGKSISSGMRFGSWEDAFRQMFMLAEKRNLAVIIDEFPYLVECVPGIASLLQKLWDHFKAQSRLRLILCGSQYQMMHAQFFTPRQPLYGRATGTLLVEEIPPQHLSQFLPRYSPTQVVETFSVIGGVPKYLELWDDRAPVLKNIRDLLLSPATIFRHEALFLIHDEVAEPRTCLAVLEAMGGGLRTPVQISKTTGLPITHVGKYLHQLLALRMIRRVQSVEAPNPAQTRLSRYEITDPFLRFHFEFMQPHQDLLEMRRIDRHMEIITSRFESYAGKSGYEELARRYVTQLGDSGELPFSPRHVGRAWCSRAEVDVFASEPKSQSVLLGECKWTTRKVDVDVLLSLQDKAEAFPRLKKWKKHFMIFSRSGFTVALRKVAAAQDVTLIEGHLIDQA